MDLVAPIVPDAQSNKGAEIFAQSLGTGLAAFARFAQMKRDSEMEMLKLAEHERLAQEQNALEKQKMAQDFELRSVALESTQTLNAAHADYFKSRAKSYAEGTATATQRAIAFNQQREELVNDINQQTAKLKLDDPNFATKQPVQFAAHVLQFEDMFSLSPLPEVKHAIKRYRTLADQQKIPIKVGATYDELKGAWEGGTQQNVPIWQVVRNMQDPAQQEATAAALQASGHTKIFEEFQEIAGQKVPVKRTEPTGPVKAALEEGKGVTFERAESRVPAAMLPKSAAGGTSPTELPEPDLPVMDEPQASARPAAVPKFDQTQTDKLISQAKAAIAKGAPSAAVAARLEEMGIDPANLWDAAA